nr:hypothetical protein [Cytophagales bacterium]
MDYVATFLGIYLLCLFKFIAGPVLGAAAGFSVFEIEVVTVAGMMTSVVAFTYLGDWIKKTWTIKIRKNNRRFTSRTRNIIKIWQKFGVYGIAALTPIFLTPIGGTILLTSFGIPKRKILTSMFVSAVIWALFFAVSIKEILRIPFFNTYLTF